MSLQWKISVDHLIFLQWSSLAKLRLLSETNVSMNTLYQYKSIVEKYFLTYQYGGVHIGFGDVSSFKRERYAGNKAMKMRMRRTGNVSDSCQTSSENARKPSEIERTFLYQELGNCIIFIIRCVNSFLQCYSIKHYNMKTLQCCSNNVDVPLEEGPRGYMQASRHLILQKK